MHKVLHHVAIAAMALALPLAAVAQNNLNLDTGTVVSSGGDIAFGASGIAPVGSAMLYDLTTAFGSSFSVLAASGYLEETLASLGYSTAPIPTSSLVVNEVFAVQTNGGNYAAAMVTAARSGSVTLQYFTFNTSGKQIQTGSATLGGPAGPSVSAVLNNYSNILPNAPNYGIAPGTLMTVYGANLAAPGSQAVLQDSSKGLPLTLNGSSVSVTVGGTTVQPAFYYAIPGQIALVLPSNTPVGNGTITVSYGGMTSLPASIKVVPSAFGFDIWGNALAAVTDNNYALLTSTHSAIPGQTYVFWGSGLGASTADSDTTYTTTPHPISVAGSPLQIYIGGIAATAVYAGRTGYPGLDQINVTIPSNVSTGCAVSVAAVSGTGSTAVVSNFATISIAGGGGTCTDPLAIVSPTESTTLSGQTTVRYGSVVLFKDTSSSGTTDEAIAVFESISGIGYSSSSQPRPSYGSCFVTQRSTTTTTNPPTVIGLDAGTITVHGPNGTETLTPNPMVTGIYSDQSPPDGDFTIPTSGGTFTFTGSGGTDVGAFSTAVAFTNPLVWTNSASDGTVTRASGVTVNWTGGSSGTYVEISGSASSSTAGFSASFICHAPVANQTFTVPVEVLLALPAGTGSLAVGNYTTPTSFTASGLDFGYAMGYASTDIDATYN